MKELFILPFFIFLLIMATGCSNQASDTGNQSTLKTEPTKTVNAGQGGNSNDYSMSSAEKMAEKLEVYYFHRTARCYSCNTMGQLLTNLINERYGSQVKEGKIDFRQLNVDLPENKEITRKFKASGSSLFINRIIDGQDKIEQDANAWRYLSNEANFNKYLGAKIDSYLRL